MAKKSCKYRQNCYLSVYIIHFIFIYGQILLQCLSRLQNFAARVMRLKKGLQKVSFLSLMKRDESIINPTEKPSFNASGPCCSSNRATSGRIVNKAKRMQQNFQFYESKVFHEIEAAIFSRTYCSIRKIVKIFRNVIDSFIIFHLIPLDHKCVDYLHRNWSLNVSQKSFTFLKEVPTMIMDYNILV